MARLAEIDELNEPNDLAGLTGTAEMARLADSDAVSKLREGYTTGTCAAGAAQAAALFLSTGNVLRQVSIRVPRGDVLVLDVLLMECGVNFCTFAARKDGGDDADMTHGLMVEATLRRCERIEKCGSVCVDTVAAVAPANGSDDVEEYHDIVFKAGDGVGVVTKSGLKISVGEPAINPVPRKMMEREIRKIFPEGGFEVTVSIPGGREIAEKTFNPKLGIYGGLSVLGTTGIVKPMDIETLIDVAKTEIDVVYASDPNDVALTFGAMGEKALIRAGVHPEIIVQTSNYLGEALDYAARKGFRRIIVGGFTGKMIKLASGVFVTHSKVADARREILICHAALEGVGREVLEELFENAAVTGAADDILLKKCGNDMRLRIWNRILKETATAIIRRIKGAITGAGVNAGASVRTGAYANAGAYAGAYANAGASVNAGASANAGPCAARISGMNAAVERDNVNEHDGVVANKKTSLATEVDTAKQSNNLTGIGVKVIMFLDNGEMLCIEDIC